jgi:biopolymer transport protein ExbD
MSMAAKTLANQAPLSELNTTPLIDVLLVLLILFIITVPASTHSLEIPLPQHGPNPPPINPTSNAVTVSPLGTIGWNGAPISESQLAALLASTTRLRPEPELRFAPDGQAPYRDTARTLRTIKASGVNGFGFVGNERFADFGKTTP